VGESQAAGTRPTSSWRHMSLHCCCGGMENNSYTWRTDFENSKAILCCMLTTAVALYS